MKKYILIIVSIIFVFNISCDKIEEPFKEIDEIVPVDTDTTSTRTYTKKVMVEDFTGHKCTYCPASHRVLDDLVDNYGDKLVPITIHAGDFTSTSTEFPTDFTTTEGTTIFEDYQVSNTPNGLVNRAFFGTDKVLTKDNWGGAIQAQIDDTTMLKLGIFIENSYNESSRELTANISVEFFENNSDTISLAIYFIEDSIIAPQIDGYATPSYVPDYLHKHVLRGSFNGAYGEEIISGAFTKNQKVDKVYTKTISSDFNEKHCAIVAFVFDTKTKEILNVEELEFLH